MSGGGCLGQIFSSLTVLFLSVTFVPSVVNVFGCGRKTKPKIQHREHKEEHRVHREDGDQRSQGALP